MVKLGESLMCKRKKDARTARSLDCGISQTLVPGFGMESSVSSRPLGARDNLAVALALRSGTPAGRPRCALPGTTEGAEARESAVVSRGGSAPEGSRSFIFALRRAARPHSYLETRQHAVY